MAVLTRLAVGVAVAGVAFLAAPVAASADTPSGTQAGVCARDTPILAAPAAEAYVLGECGGGDKVVTYCTSQGPDGNLYYGVDDPQAAEGDAAGYVAANDVDLDSTDGLFQC